MRRGTIGEEVACNVNVNALNSSCLSIYIIRKDAAQKQYLHVDGFTKRLGLVSTSARSTIVGVSRETNATLGAVGASLAGILGHAVVSAVLRRMLVTCRNEREYMMTYEAKVGDAVVALDTGGLFKAGGKVIRDLTEDGNLALDDLLATTILHVTRDIADEALLGAIVKDFLP